LIYKAMEKLRLIRSLKTDYYSILRQKLSWGKSIAGE